MDFRSRTVRVPGLAGGRGLDFDVLADDSIIGPAIERGSWEEHETALSVLRRVELSRTVGRAAVTALRELSAAGGLHHRVRLADVLIAACAQEAGIGVLHYDAHFDRLAEVMEFESRWIAPAGSL